MEKDRKTHLTGSGIHAKQLCCAWASHRDRYAESTSANRVGSLSASFNPWQENCSRQWWITEWYTKKWKKIILDDLQESAFAFKILKTDLAGTFGWRNVLETMHTILGAFPPCANFPWNILKPRGSPRIHRSPRFSSALWEVATIDPIHQAGPKGVPCLQA